MKGKKLICGILSAVLLLSAAACSSTPPKSTSSDASSASQAGTQTPSQVNQEETSKTPKYVFLFIGDGMSYPQFQMMSVAARCWTARKN